MSESAEVRTSSDTSSPVAPESASPEGSAPSTSGDPTAAPASGETSSESREESGLRNSVAALTRKLNKANREREAMQRELEQSKAGKQPAEQKPEAKRPQQGDYDTYEAFLSAEMAWQMDQRFAKEAASREQREAQAKQERERDEADVKWAQQEAAAHDKYPDYDTVVRNKDLNISHAMVDAMKAAENGADIAYHLGKNPQLADQMFHLGPIDAALAIGALGASLVQGSKSPKPRSRAPEPTDGGRSTQASQEPGPRDDQPMNVWLRERRKQVYGG